MKYRPSRDIPEAVRQLKSTSPTLITDWILDRRNTEKTPESITMWFRRHPTIKEDLEIEIKAGQVEEKVMTEQIFESGVFETYASIANWIREMRRRSVKKINDRVSTMKRVCRGVKPKKGVDLTFQGWSFKHPDRFSLQDAIEFIDLMLQHYPDIDISGERLVMRNFLDSKGIHVGKKISGAKHSSAGKYAKMFVAREYLTEIFDWLRRVNYEAFVIDFFMFKTGTRIGATLKTRLEEIIVEGQYVEIRVYDKGRKSIYPKGKPWDKHISTDLFKEIKQLTGYPTKTAGNIFSLTDDDMSKLNRQGIEKFYPQLWEVYPDYDDVNHFWRHMFAQHMLRKTNWNYGVVAALGGWEVKSLEESYGKPPRAIVREWGLETLPEL